MVNIKNKKKRKKQVGAIYEDNFAHLLHELQRLDLLIQKRVLLWRMQNSVNMEMPAKYQPYVSHEEVDSLLQPGGDISAESADLKKVRRQIINLQNEIHDKIKASLAQGVYLSLPHLAQRFGLSPFEAQ